MCVGNTPRHEPREEAQQMEYIAFDAHKRYTLASLLRPDDGLVREQRIARERGAPPKAGHRNIPDGTATSWLTLWSRFRWGPRRFRRARGPPRGVERTRLLGRGAEILTTLYRLSAKDRARDPRGCIGAPPLGPRLDGVTAAEEDQRVAVRPGSPLRRADTGHAAAPWPRSSSRRS